MSSPEQDILADPFWDDFEEADSNEKILPLEIKKPSSTYQKRGKKKESSHVFGGSSHSLWVRMVGNLRSSTVREKALEGQGDCP